MGDTTPNVINFDDLKQGRTLPRVRLTQDLIPERVYDYVVDQVAYQKGWIGSVIEIEPHGNREGWVPVLFDEYEHPVWIERKYLEQA